MKNYPTQNNPSQDAGQDEMATQDSGTIASKDTANSVTDGSHSVETVPSQAKKPGLTQQEAMEVGTIASNSIQSKKEDNSTRSKEAEFENSLDETSTIASNDTGPIGTVVAGNAYTDMETDEDDWRPTPRHGKKKETEDDDKMEAAGNVPDLNPPRPVHIRYDLKMQLPASTNKLETALTEFRQIFAALRAVDNSILLYPWAGKCSVSPAIKSRTLIPTTPTNIHAYFPRFQTRKTEGAMYTTLYLGHTMLARELLDGMYVWLSEKKHQMFIRQLQVPKVVEIGWLCYSTRQMDTTELREEIAKYIGCPVGLRWRKIMTTTQRMVKKAPKTDGPKLKDKENIQAIHVEISKEDFRIGKQELHKLY
jgi:hypothetical protein